MLMVQVNPFIIEGYLSPEYFCDWWHTCPASLCLSSVDIPIDSQAETGAHGYRFRRKAFFSDVTRVLAEVSSWCKHRAGSGQRLCLFSRCPRLVQSMPVRRSVSSPHNKGRQFASTKTWQTTWWLSSPRCSPCMPCFVIQVWRQTRLQPISNRYSKHIHPIRWQRYCKQYGR